MINTMSIRETQWLTMIPQYDSVGLSIGNHSIVERWEQPIQETLAELVCQCQSPKILEIGYGLGLSAIAVSRFNPSLHLIVEAHPIIAANAIKQLPKTSRLLIDFWERVIHNLQTASFNGIIFDAYPITTTPFDGSAEGTFQHVKPFILEGERLLPEGGKLVFIDFSLKVTALEGFQSIIHTIFSKLHVKSVALNIPPVCSYAQGDSGNVIILEK